MPGQFTEAQLLLPTIGGLGLRDTYGTQLRTLEAPVILAGVSFLARRPCQQRRVGTEQIIGAESQVLHPALQLLKLLLVPTRRFEGASQLGPGLARPLF
jgi:hypothetical protein